MRCHLRARKLRMLQGRILDAAGHFSNGDTQPSLDCKKKVELENVSKRFNVGVCPKQRPMCVCQLLCSNDFISANSLRFGFPATTQNVSKGQSHWTTAINKEDDKTFKRE